MSTPVTRMCFPSRSPTAGDVRSPSPVRPNPVRGASREQGAPGTGYPSGDRLERWVPWAWTWGSSGGPGRSVGGWPCAWPPGGGGHHRVARPRRAAEIAAEVVARWPGRALAITGADNAGAAARDVVVVATPWESAPATVRGLAAQLEGKVVVSMANALVKEGREMLAARPAPGIDGRRRGRRGARRAGGGRLPPPAGLVSWRTSTRASWPTCWSAPTIPRPPRPPWPSSTRSRACGPSTPGAWPRRPPSRPSPPCCVTLNIRYKAHSTLRLAGI